MSTSHPVNATHTSVFNALGSYADRIKDSNTTTANPTSTTAKPSKSPNGTAPHTAAPSTTATSSIAPSPKAGATNLAQPVQDVEDDGSWETVQSGRHRPKQEEKRGGASTSRNWRERVPTEQSEEDGRHAAGAKPGTKGGTSTNTPSGSTVEKTPAPRPNPTTGSSALGTKSAWAIPTPTASTLPSSATKTLESTSSTTIQIPKQTPKTGSSRQSRTVPSSPSLNASTTTDTSSSLPPSLASPTLLAITTSVKDLANVHTMATKSGDEEEGSWRAKPKKEKVPEPPVPRQPAAPPAVNAWDLRKKAMGTVPNGASPTSSNMSKSPATGPVLQFGTVTPSVETPKENALRIGNSKPEEGSKAAKKKAKKAASEPTSTTTTMADPTLWPDVAQAAAVARSEDEKKDKVREKSDACSVVTEDATTGGKKTKWKAIPASELLAAADEVTEQNRRQAASRRKLAKAESSTAPFKPKSRKSSIEGRKPQPASGEIRLPPMPAGAGRGEAGFKPMFGSVRAGSETESVAGDIRDVGQISSSAPLSRQPSRHSRRDGSPQYSRTTLPSPSSQPLDLDPTSSMRLSTGPYSKGMTGSTTAPLPQHPFASSNGVGHHGMSRTPRYRDNRGSFSGTNRGRGGYRSTSNPLKGFTSPVMGQNGLPMDGGANVYARGMGMGYGQYHPNGMGYMPNYSPQGMFDPIQAQFMQMYGRGQAPPPPMPQTQVIGIDPQRFYVLGQVEYYFSIQNLAMDFFLRQQMDTEGWIDISMIASFNRLKSLTPDIAMVKEVMHLSAILEVREDQVRLAGGESKRWVLPDAKSSIFPAGQTPEQPSVSSPSIENGNSNICDMGGLNLPGLGMEDMNVSALPTMPKYSPGDVENAMMKSVPPSSSASVLNGDESMEKGDTTTTPATSASGDKEDEERQK